MQVVSTFIIESILLVTAYGLLYDEVRTIFYDDYVCITQKG